jgi:hypothetical protein
MGRNPWTKRPFLTDECRRLPGAAVVWLGGSALLDAVFHLKG